MTDLGVLTSAGRNRVRRVRAGDRPLIVKEYLTEDDGWARESAALAVLPDSVRAPRLVASTATPPAVVMTDAGDGGSVARALLGDDPGAAADAVVAWATAIAELHRATAGSRPGRDPRSGPRWTAAPPRRPCRATSTRPPR